MRDLIVVLGAEVPSGRAVAKKLRAEHYCCALMASGAPLASVAQQSPAGIIIAGEAQEGAEAPDAGVLSLGVPVLSLGSSTRALLEQLGTRREGEAVSNSVVPVMYKESPLFEDIGSGERWIACAESFAMAEPYQVIADGDQFPLAFANPKAHVYLLQFQIERNDPDGMAMLLSFADTICGCTPWWTVENIVQSAEKAIRMAVDDGEAICAMSGGLDSAVAAMLAKRALGDRVRCVFVNTGLLRRGEADQAERYFRGELRLNFSRIDAEERVLGALKGLTATHDKRRVIENEITRMLLEEAASTPGGKVFIKGTNYVDVLEGEPHEDIGRFPAVVEPLRELFKNEIRMIGEFLSLSPSLLGRQPFPGVGLAVRAHGEVTADRLELLRTADAVFTEALVESGQERRLSRYFALLVQIDGRDTVVLRATQGAEPKMSASRLPHDLLERVTEQLLRELPTIERVLYDMTPGAAEWA